MKRVLALIFTFVVGVVIANIWDQALSFDINDVPSQKSHVESAEVDSSVPKFIPFFDSIGKDENYHGWFTVDEFTGMDEVWAVQLTRDSDEQDNLQWYALVRTTNPDHTDSDDHYISRSLSAKHDSLTFTTTRVRNIDYTFEGKFLYGGSVFGQDQKVLKGTLRKRINGKVVATVRSDFGYAEPYCLQ